MLREPVCGLNPVNDPPCPVLVSCNLAQSGDPESPPTRDGLNELFTEAFRSSGINARQGFSGFAIFDTSIESKCVGVGNEESLSFTRCFGR